MAKKKSSNRLIYIIVGVLVVGIIGFIAARAAGLIGQPDAIEVELAVAGPHTIIEKVNASGMIQPETEVKISPDVPGEIIELPIREGDSVARGQLLLRIRPDNFQSALARQQAVYNQQQANLASARSRLAQSEAQFSRTEKDFQRSQTLYKQNVISDAEFEQAKANFQVAKEEKEAAAQNVQAARYMVESAAASVREAKENLNLTSIFAPVSGTVSKLSVEQGERVVGTSQMAGTEMLRIADLNSMEVRVDVNENDIIRISKGDSAIIEVDSYNYLNRKFKGVVTAIASTANQKASPDAVTEFEVKIRILNSSYEDLIKERGLKIPFKPGMTASVEIITNQKDNVLSVPLAAVTTRNKNNPAPENEQQEEGEEAAAEAQNRPPQAEEVKEVVFVNKGGKAVMVEVQTGISDFQHIEIIKGLERGQEVVAGPYLVVSKRLNEGDEIKPQEAENEQKKGNF